MSSVNYHPQTVRTLLFLPNYFKFFNHTIIIGVCNYLNHKQLISLILISAAVIAGENPLS